MLLITGYGRILLSNVLPLKGTYEFNLFIEDHTGLGPNHRLIYTATVTSSSRPLK
jgi:hypothetical protein